MHALYSRSAGTRTITEASPITHASPQAHLIITQSSTTLTLAKASLHQAPPRPHASFIDARLTEVSPEHHRLQSPHQPRHYRVGGGGGALSTRTISGGENFATSRNPESSNTLLFLGGLRTIPVISWWALDGCCYFLRCPPKGGTRTKKNLGSHAAKISLGRGGFATFLNGEIIPVKFSPPEAPPSLYT